MIEIKNLNKKFDSKKIFENFNYKIKTGSLTAIIGVSGSGKSTLLNMIGLLDNDYEGEILYNQINVSKKTDRERLKFIRDNIKYLFQNYALIDDETVEYNLLLALEYEKYSRKEKLSRIAEALRLVNLEAYEDQYIYKLSGGEQQRVALARIILKKGDIILADEPTGNLDQFNSEIVMNILYKMKKEGKTVIIVTHDKKIAKMCDEIIEL